MTKNGTNGKNVIVRVKNFLKSLYFHLYRGMPKSDQFTINTRYAVCVKCESFDLEQCMECGCLISKKKEFFNKLAWKDQECPLKKWDV